MAVCAHHDQVRGQTARGLEHALGRIAAYHERFVAHCRRNPFPRELYQFLLPILFMEWIGIQWHRLEAGRAGWYRRDIQQVQFGIVLLRQFQRER